MTAQELVAELKRRGMSISTVESCSGGALASSITDVIGASEVFSQGWVVYSDEAKIRLARSISPGREQGAKDCIQIYTVYSHQMAVLLSQMGQEASGSHLSIGVTGRMDQIGDQVKGRVYVGILTQKTQVTFTVDLEAENRREAKDKLLGWILYRVGKLLIS